MTDYDSHPLREKLVPLNLFHRGDKGIIKALIGPEPLLKRLMDLGVIEGEQVFVLHEAPFGKDPIAVQVRGTLLALRRVEASAVIVQKAENL